MSEAVDDLDFYKSQLGKLMFAPVDDKTWEAIVLDGLDEDEGKPEKAQWLQADLVVSPEDHAALKMYDEDVTDKFNRFDLWLVEDHEEESDTPTIVIDYDVGGVKVVKSV